MRSLTRGAAALLFAAAVALSVPADEVPRQKLARAGKAASAFVRVKDGSGSAFCVHPSGLFVTNQHVVEGAGAEVTLVLNANQKDQRVVKARVLRGDREADLALLQAEDVKDWPALPVAGDDNTLSEGDEVVACGFPLGKTLALSRDEYPAVTVTFGRVTALRQKSGELYRIQLDVELHPGNSGGPILGADGKVVGVAVAGIRGTSFRFAIPARALGRFIEAPAITFRPPAPGGPGDWHRPLDFEVRAVSVLPSEKPMEAELTLHEPGGKERKYPMKRAGGGSLRASAPLLSAASAAPMVRCTVVVSRGGKELARLGRWIVDEGKVPTLYLADLPECDFRKGPWDLGIGFAGRHFKTPMRVGGEASPRGLCTHPNCSVSYGLKKGGLLFRARAGIDDSGRPGRGGAVTFEVLGDGKVLWASRLFARGESAECSADVAGVDTLELRVSAEGNNQGAHAVWMEPNVLADGKRLRPPPAVALDEKGRTVKDLPAAVEDVALGGGGRYLVLAMPRAGKLLVVDVTNPRAERSVPLSEAGPVRVAAGADKLLVLYTEKKVLERYDLATLKNDAGIDLPFDGDKVFSAAMGSASHGPLLVVGEKPLFGVSTLIDVQRMRKLHPDWRGQAAAHTGDTTTATASADGRVFAIGASNLFSRGFHAIHWGSRAATIYPSRDFPFYACPGPDGRFVFTSNGVYTGQLHDPEKGPHHRGCLCVPAAQGDFYARASSSGGSFTLYLVGEEDPLVEVTGVGPLLKVTSVGWPVPGAAPEKLPPVKRLFLVPAADLIVTVPADRQEVRFHKFSFSGALQRADDYLFVAAFAPPAARKGERFRHELTTRSKKGGVKYEILSGPDGMAVSEKGEVEWQVPKGFAAGVSEVRVRLRGASGRESVHAFAVRVE